MGDRYLANQTPILFQYPQKSRSVQVYTSPT
uniref:Uncharacterized protein n=1 Tax=Moniliophthora roreri TaxID=221103 RepID=A0A0W0GC99_MONRR